MHYYFRDTRPHEARPSICMNTDQTHVHTAPVYRLHLNGSRHSQWSCLSLAYKPGPYNTIYLLECQTKETSLVVILIS